MLRSSKSCHASKLKNQRNGSVCWTLMLLLGLTFVTYSEWSSYLLIIRNVSWEASWTTSRVLRSPYPLLLPTCSVNSKSWKAHHQRKNKLSFCKHAQEKYRIALYGTPANVMCTWASLCPWSWNHTAASNRWEVNLIMKPTASNAPCQDSHLAPALVALQQAKDPHVLPSLTLNHHKLCHQIGALMQLLWEPVKGAQWWRSDKLAGSRESSRGRGHFTEATLPPDTDSASLTLIQSTWAACDQSCRKWDFSHHGTPPLK